MRNLSFIIAGIKLQIEMILQYIQALSVKQLSEEEIKADTGLSLLMSVLQETAHSASITLSTYSKQLSLTHQGLGLLRNTLLTFKQVNLAGTIESVRTVNSNQGFLLLSQQMEQMVTAAQSEMKSFDHIIDDLRNDSSMTSFTSTLARFTLRMKSI